VGWWNAKNMVMVGYEMKNWFIEAENELKK
jgi:hypothetical protein